MCLSGDVLQKCYLQLMWPLLGKNMHCLTFNRRSLLDTYESWMCTMCQPIKIYTIYIIMKINLCFEQFIQAVYILQSSQEFINIYFPHYLFQQLFELIVNSSLKSHSKQVVAGIMQYIAPIPLKCWHDKNNMRKWKILKYLPCLFFF